MTANGGINTTTLTASGDLKYNGSTSLTAQMATLNGYKTSGSFLSNTTFQTIFTPSSAVASRGFITVATSGGGANSGMVMAFFEYSSGNTYPSLTQLALSGNTFPQATITGPNTCNGSQVVFLQMLQSSGYPIQVKANSSMTVYWYITFM